MNWFFFLQNSRRCLVSTTVRRKPNDAACLKLESTQLTDDCLRKQCCILYEKAKCPQFTELLTLSRTNDFPILACHCFIIEPDFSFIYYGEMNFTNYELDKCNLLISNTALKISWKNSHVSINWYAITLFLTKRANLHLTFHTRAIIKLMGNNKSIFKPRCLQCINKNYHFIRRKFCLWAEIF